MPRVLKVESRNQWFQRVEALLRNRKKRHREGAFVVEGVRSLNQLVAHPSWRIEAFLYDGARGLSSWAEGLFRNSRADVHLEVASELMAELSDKEETSEVLAVVSIPPDDPARLPARSDALYVLIDRPGLPGNLGTLIRSCDGLGAHGLAMFGHGADLFDPRTVRSSAGSLFALPTVRIEGWDSLEQWIAALKAGPSGCQVVATTARTGTLPSDIELTGPTVLAIGNETSGLSFRLEEMSDTLASIPMGGAASSLNVACAATVFLYEVGRQRGG